MVIAARTGPSQADLAAGLGVSQPMVSKLKAKGMPTYSVAAAQAWRAANLNQAHRRGHIGHAPAAHRTDDADVNPESFNEARRRREIADANTAEARYAELAGALVRKAAVKAEWERTYATHREAMLQIPGRLAAQLAAETDQAKCHALLEAEVRAALDLMSRGG